MDHVYGQNFVRSYREVKFPSGEYVCVCVWNTVCVQSFTNSDRYGCYCGRWDTVKTKNKYLNSKRCTYYVVHSYVRTNSNKTTKLLTAKRCYDTRTFLVHFKRNGGWLQYFCFNQTRARSYAKWRNATIVYEKKNVKVLRLFSAILSRLKIQIVSAYLYCSRLPVSDDILSILFWRTN